MKLKRVEIQGFKSFADRTVLDFDEGITAILGPNGCGKTNIVDAIRWVLGEQSAKQLRGGRMEDIIFKGTTKRKPVTLAEVGLTFTNEDRGIPVEYDEVTIKRRVTRDGISQYLVNGSPVRLKDLRDLFWDSGVSNSAYAVIELPMINQVLNEHTQELRGLIEEGSGIVKYKSRRREAERKLEQTEADLLRLRDLLDEIGREVRSLARQVGKARRHQRLFKEVRGIDLLLAGRQHHEFGRREEELAAQSGELKTLAEADAGELADLRARIEATRPAVDEREAERRGLEESLHAFEEALQEAERRVLVLEQRMTENERRGHETREAIGGAQVRRAEIHGEAALLAQRLAGVAEQLGHHEAELREREEQLKVLEGRFAASRQAVQEAAQMNLEFIEHDAAARTLQRELHVRQENRRERLQRLAEEETVLREAAGRDGARAAGLEESRRHRLDQRRELLEAQAGLERERTEAQAGAETLRQELSAREARREALRSRHDLLRRIKDEYRGYRQGARHVLQSRADDGRVRGSLADRLRVADGWGEAFENLFAELVDAVVVDEAGTAVGLVGELRAGEAGRASFLSGAGAEPAAPAGVAPTAGRPARDLVSGEAAAAPHLRRLLAACWTFEDDAAAVAAAAAHGGDQVLVCLARSGLLVTSDGVVRGGSRREEEASLLGRGEKLERIEEEIAAAVTEVETWAARLDENGARQRELQEYLLRGRAELEGIEEDLRRLHAEGAEARSREAAAVGRLAVIERERTTVVAEQAALTAEEEGLRGRLDESERQRTDSATRVTDLRGQAAELERDRDAARAAVAELRLVRSRAEGERRETETAIAHLRDSGAELSAREERLAQETQILAEQAATMAAELVERREQLAGGFQERERRRQLVQAAAESIRALHAETNAWHDRVKAIEEQRAGCRERLHGFETELATLEVRRRNLVDRVEEQYKGAFRELVRAVDPAALPDELERDGEVFQTDQAAALLADRREQLNALGPVNQLAIEEYETKKERLRFLETQLRDVEKAKADLLDVIQQINRTARKLFGDTFEEVRRNFIAVFQTLFEGGRAELELIRTDDPLEGQIRIVAQPRGKLVDHVGLLSGGERCLTALSLLFAVYLVKPSPFCLLDEVDGPLDDSNTNRFVRMLREFSGSTQFLVVTHNKLTMETANHLFGVTMMEAGVSSLVSVSFQDVAQTRSDDELGRAIATRRRELDRQSAARALLAGDAGEDGQPGGRFTLEDADADPVDPGADFDPDPDDADAGIDAATAAATAEPTAGEPPAADAAAAGEGAA
ncbi:MAG: chromosome segregation protein SMC [Candidatus Krumholzibacteriia bacterium]